jgi:F-type H+-transporting ATPase subunit b
MMTEIVAPLVNFAVVVFILVKFGRQPLRDFLAARSKQIADAMREAEKESTEAKHQLAEAEKNWRASQANAQRFVEDAKSSIIRFREHALAAAKQEAERVRKEASLVETTERLRARRSLQQEVARKSVAMAGQYLQTHLGEKERHKLVTDYVEIVQNGTAE